MCAESIKVWEHQANGTFSDVDAMKAMSAL
jgi:hypothetical protein